MRQLPEGAPSTGADRAELYWPVAVHLLRGGADIRHVQEFLLHTDLDTTKIYLRIVPGRLAEAYHKAMPEVAVNL